MNMSIDTSTNIGYVTDEVNLIKDLLKKNLTVYGAVDFEIGNRRKIS